jgi:hypothetical protein
MRRFALICCATVLVGCAKSENRPAGDTMAAGEPTPQPAAGIALADVAGKWKQRTTDEAGGTVVESEFIATADTSGWTLTLPNRNPIPVRVAVSGDSIITDAGPFESVVRKGVQVTTHTVYRLQDGKLVGTTEAHYALNGRDSVGLRPTVATRAQ